MLKVLSVLLTFLLFVSCVGEVPKLSPISLISTSFNPGNYSSFAGGIIIVGEDQSGNRIHHSFPNGVITPFSIPRGDWKFYGVGYDGISFVERGVTKIAQMEGAISRGTANVEVKLGKQATIDLALTPDGCSGELYRDLKINTMIVEPCSYFGVYNYPANTYTPSTAFTLNEYGMIPIEQWGGISYYRLTTLKGSPGQFTEGLESRCAISFLGNASLQVPTSVVPMQVKTYRTLSLCEEDEYRHSEYSFPDGLQNKNSSEFDSEYVVSTNVLYIPETHTKRFRSPLMNTMPRLLCKNNLNLDVECRGGNFTSTRSLTIQWDKPLKDVLLITDPREDACDTIATNSRFFQISECKIKNKYLYATLSRNKLSCVDSATAGSLTYKDIKYRDGKMYMLYVKAGSSYAAVYNEGGQLLIEFNVGPASTNWNALAVGKDDTFWVSNAASSSVIKYKPNGPTSFTADNALFGANGIAAESLEVSDDGNYLFVGKQGTNDIFVYELMSGLLGIVDTITLSEDVRNIQFFDGKLYAHGSDSPGLTNGTFYRMSFNAGELSILQSPSAGTSKTFHVDKGYFITVGSGNEALVFPNMVSQGVMSGVYGTGVNTFAGNVDRLQIVNYQLYGFAHGTNNFYTMGWTPANWATGTWVTGASSVDSCSESTVTIFENGIGKNILSLATNKALPDNIQRNRELFHAATKFIGNRYFDYSLIPIVKEANQDPSRVSTSYLSMAQRLMGPHGVGGMLYDFNDCSSIKTALLGGSIRRSYAVTDPYRGYQSYDIRIQSNTDTIHPFICDDTLINSTCSNQYEIKIDVASTGLFETESYQMKLKCDSKVGQLRYSRNNGNRSSQEQYYWNTNDQSQQRYDAYRFRKDSGYSSREMALVFKQGEYVISRSVHFEEWTNYRQVAIDHYEKVAGDHSVYHEELTGFTSGVPVGNPALFSSTNYAALRNQSDYSSFSTARLNVWQTNIDIATSSTTLAPIGISNSKNVPLSLSSIENSSSFELLFNNFP